MDTLWRDIRYGLRILARSPGFTAIVVLVLAVGIGGTTAIFSVVNAVLLRPLPYREPNRLVTLLQQKQGGSETNIARANFAYWREHNEVFEEIAAYAAHRAYLTGLDHPRHMVGDAVSPCLFSLLGARPMLGRTFLPDEEKLGNHRVVILSHAFWRDQWGAEPNVIGKTVELDGEPHSIVGVMPPGFRSSMLHSMPFWVPLVLDKSYAVMAIARLKKGVTLEQARAHMTLIARQFGEIDPKHAGYTATVHRYLDVVFGNNRRILLLLLGAASFVLLIACSNVASLLLARAALRRQEIGVRLAVGASRGRIMRQVLTESIIMSTAGGLLGLLVTYWAVRGLVDLCPADIPRIGQTRVDLAVLAFTMGVSMFTGLLFGLIPAWRTANMRLGQVRSPTGRGWQRLRDGLVVSQIGIALTLLMGAALLIQSLMALHKVDLGFQPRNVLIMHVEIPQMRYPQPQQQKAFFDQLLETVRATPGVRSAALATVRLELARGGTVELISIGSRPANRDELSEVDSRRVGRDFFETMGMPALRGRTFTEQDVRVEATTPPQNLIIDEALVHRYFPDVDPVGQRIYYSEKLSGVVVGVVPTIKDFAEPAPARGMLYYLVSQRYFHVMDVVIKTDGEPMRLAAALRSQVHALDKDQACELRTLESTLAEMLGPRRFSLVLLGIYAGTALIIACAGLYGLLQFMVARQAHEIGIRMALGARNADILRMVLKHGLALTLVGVGAGLVGTLVLTRLISSLLYGVRATDPATFVGVSLILTGVALAASSIPARRAARIDPMVALRYE